MNLGLVTVLGDSNNRLSELARPTASLRLLQSNPGWLIFAGWIYFFYLLHTSTVP